MGEARFDVRVALPQGVIGGVAHLRRILAVIKGVVMSNLAAEARELGGGFGLVERRYGFPRQRVGMGWFRCGLAHADIGDQPPRSGSGLCAGFYAKARIEQMAIGLLGRCFAPAYASAKESRLWPCSRSF